jgi:hypothetical protein
MIPYKISFRISIVLFLLFGAAGCALPEIESTWRDREVIIDGIDEGSEWENARYILEDENMILGVLNDNDFLYLRLSTRDRDLQRQVLTAGFTVWLNENGKKKETFGIHFPLGNRAGGMPMMRRGGEPPTGENPNSEHPAGDNSNGESPLGVPPMGDDPDQLENMIIMAQTGIEILGPAEDARTFLTPDDLSSSGIEVKLDESKGILVYELCIPFVRDESHPYGIGAKHVNEIAIGLESGSYNMNQMRNQSGNPGSRGGRGGMGGMGGGGMGGPGGGMGGPGGGRGGMGSRGGTRGGGMITEPVEFWFNAVLAQES